MQRSIAAFLCATSMLAGCQQMSSTVDQQELLNQMEGPEVSGVDDTLLKRAEAAESQGDFRATAQTYQQLLDKDPKNIALAIRFGEALRRSGNAQTALEIFNRILKDAPENLDAMESKGLTELSLADMDAASKTLTKVMEFSPNRWRTLNGIGILFATKGLYEESLQYFNSALEQRPNHPAIINNKGLVQALNRDFYASIANLLQASEVAKSPLHKVRADLNAALVYAIAGDLDNSEAMASKHLEGAALQNNLGLYALLAKNDDLARTHLHMALSESKVFYEKAWNNLNNMTQGSHANVKESDKSKRIQLSGDAANTPTLPMLPQPDSASTGATTATEQKQAVVPTRQVPILNAPPASAAAPTPLTPVTAIPLEAGTASGGATVIPIASPTASALPTDSINNTPAHTTEGAVPAWKDLFSSFNSTSQPATSAIPEASSNLNSKPVIADSNANTSNTAPDQASRTIDAATGEQDTSLGVYNAQKPASGGNINESSKTTSMEPEKQSAPSNGFQSFEEFISNW